MSIKVMVKVWEKELDKKEQPVLLAMADHANEVGCRVYPSLALMAWKTGMSVRTVKRIVGSLRAKGYIQQTRPPGHHRPAEYKICLNDIPNKKPFAEWKKELLGVSLSPFEEVTNHDGMSDKHEFMGDKTAFMGDKVLSPEPSFKPSLKENRHKREPKETGGTNAPKKLFGEFVLLTDDEYNRLVEERGEKFVKLCIDKLDNWIGSQTEKKIVQLKKRDHNRTIRNWVIEAVDDRLKKSAGRSYNSQSRMQQVNDAIDAGFEILDQAGHA